MASDWLIPLFSRSEKSAPIPDQPQCGGPCHRYFNEGETFYVVEKRRVHFIGDRPAYRSVEVFLCDNCFS